MARNDFKSDFLLGFVAGAGLTVAAVVWIERARRARAARARAGRVDSERQLEALERGSARSRARREQRTRRRLDNRIERMRSAGL